jgi:hypothetical protein
MNRIQILATTALAFASTTIVSTVPAAADDWKVTVTPYAWATDVGIDVKVDDRQVIDQEIAVEDLVEDLDTTFQGRLEAQKGAHGLFVDVFDVNLSDDPKTVGLPMGAGQATLSPEMGMTILDLGGFYDPQGDHRGLQLLYGVRLLNQRATLGVEVHRADGVTVARELEVDETLVDALVGLRFLRPLGNRFSLETSVDVSHGGTDLTWSAGSTFGYRFGHGDKYTAILGYRRLVVDFDDSDGVDATMTLSGPLAGLRITF